MARYFFNGSTASAVLFAIGCGSSTQSADGNPVHGNPAGGPAADPSFAAVYAIFDAHCEICHGGQAPVAGLDFSTEETAYKTTVGVHAGGEGSVCAGSGLVRVDPGSASKSLLYLKISGTQPCGDRMPYHQTPLGGSDIAEIASWINDGAPKE
jgi:hypothetical protein